MRKVTARLAKRKTYFFPCMCMWYLPLTGSTFIPQIPREAEEWEENETPTEGSPACDKYPRRGLQFLFGSYVHLLDNSTSL